MLVLNLVLVTLQHFLVVSIILAFDSISTTAPGLRRFYIQLQVDSQTWQDVDIQFTLN